MSDVSSFVIFFIMIVGRIIIWVSYGRRSNNIVGKLQERNPHLYDIPTHIHKRWANEQHKVVFADPENRKLLEELERSRSLERQVLWILILLVALLMLILA